LTGDKMKFYVGVFAEKKKRGPGLKLNAYTRDFNIEWSGGNLVEVEAVNGTAAKKVAKEILRRLWSARPDQVRVSE